MTGSIEAYALRCGSQRGVSIMSDHGVPIEKISDLVGHSDSRITETIYRHQLKPEIRDGAERMNDIFKSA